MTLAVCAGAEKSPRFSSNTTTNEARVRNINPLNTALKSEEVVPTNRKKSYSVATKSWRQLDDQTVERGLDFTLDTTWVSRYIWNGFDRNDNKPTFQSSISAKPKRCNFSFGVWGASEKTTMDAIDSKELQYFISYHNSAFKDSKFEVNFTVGWTYYEFFERASENADFQELYAEFILPKLFSDKNLRPIYHISWFPSALTGKQISEIGGFIHTFGLEYDIKIPRLSEPATFSWDITYNDGVGVTGKSEPHDWSHMTWRLSLPFKLGHGTVAPEVFYQKSFEDTVNDDNEIGVGIYYRLEF